MRTEKLRNENEVAEKFYSMHLKSPFRGFSGVSSKIFI